MKTEISIQGKDFYINGKPTYHGRFHEGRRIEGLLFNSRMVQAIFDDENSETIPNWCYPDTKFWDPDRNTDEFCKWLPVYRTYGVLGVTIGLQGGGPIYTPEIYDRYINSAFNWDGTLKPSYTNRLKRVLDTADNEGIIVILNYFYWQQSRRFDNDDAIRQATRLATEWILERGYRNVMIDANNEVKAGSGLLESERIHEIIQIIQGISINGHRLLAGTSIHPLDRHPPGKWPEFVDFFLPHGNDSPGEILRRDIQKIKSLETYQNNPRPILINEDSIDIPNLDVAVDEGASWGLYSQGFGSQYRDTRWDWRMHDREETFEELSGYQTPPVNWGINTDFKKAFFNRVKAITGS